MEQSNTPPPGPQLHVENRVDAAVVTVIVTTYANGRPTQERTLQPVKVFRAAAPDLWGAIDQHLHGTGANRGTDQAR